MFECFDRVLYNLFQIATPGLGSHRVPPMLIIFSGMKPLVSVGWDQPLTHIITYIYIYMFIYIVYIYIYVFIDTQYVHM